MCRSVPGSCNAAPWVATSCNIANESRQKRMNGTLYVCHQQKVMKKRSQLDAAKKLEYNFIPLITTFKQI
jgi:hypothetical protein